MRVQVTRTTEWGTGGEEQIGRWGGGRRGGGIYHGWRECGGRGRREEEVEGSLAWEEGMWREEEGGGGAGGGWSLHVRLYTDHEIREWV